MWIGFTINHHQTGPKFLHYSVFDTREEALRDMIEYYFDFGYFDYIHDPSTWTLGEKKMKSFIADQIPKFESIHEFRKNYKNTFLDNHCEYGLKMLEDDLNVYIVEYNKN